MRESILVRTLQPGSVIVDVSIDQGGCIETSRPISLTGATFGYVMRLASGGLSALKADAGLAKGTHRWVRVTASEQEAATFRLVADFSSR